jgi:uncharacterized membrane protein YeaQ/YmgE (transglycosylase-associated protein family)
MWMIAVLLFVGLASGWTASLIVRGEKRPSDWGLLLGVGIGGSLLGGIVVNLVRGNGLKLQFTGVIGSIIGACLLLALVTALRGGGKGGTKKKAAAGGEHHEPRGGRKRKKRR